METILSNLFYPSFEHVLHSCGLCLVSTYKYEINNCFLNFISYCLYKFLSSFQLTQNNITHLNQYLLLNIETTKLMRLIHVLLICGLQI